MKKNLFRLAVLSLTAFLSACSFQAFHTHRLTQHYGFSVVFKDKGLTDYYLCEDCGTYFDKNQKEVKTLKGIRINKYRDVYEPALIIGRDVDFTYRPEYVSELEDVIKVLKQGIKDENKSNSSIVSLANEYIGAMGDFYNDIVYSMVLGDVFYDYDYYDLQSEITNYRYTMRAELNEVYKLAATSKYKSLFFKDMSDEEIDEYLNGNDESTEQAAKLQDLKNKMNTVVNRFNQTEDADAATLFKQYKGYANEYAQLQGYKDYVDYCYQVTYRRDYTIDDILSIKDYMKEYAVDTYISMFNEFKNLKNSLSYLDKVSYTKLESSVSGSLDVVEKYLTKFIGEGMKTSYNDFINSGNYFFSDIENPTTTAYSTSDYDGKPLLMFTKDYQEAYVFVHEFGHLNGDRYSNAYSYDLFETQSQGNEALFYYYLMNENTGLSKKGAKLYAYAKLMNFFWSIFGVYAVVLVEDYAYTHDDFTTKDLQNVWDTYFSNIGYNSINDLTGYSSYWSSYLFNSPLYVSSYVTSALGALELYAKANEDIKVAKEMYHKIYTIDEKKYPFQKAYEYIGLDNVFELDTFKTIKNVFTK